MISLVILLASAAPGLDDLFDPFSDAFPVTGERVKRKQEAFEFHLEKRGPGALLRAMQRCEPALEDLDRNRQKVHARLIKARDRYFGWMEKYKENYRRKHKQDPAHYPMPESTNRDFIDAETAMRQANSLMLREFDFHRWAEARLAKLAPKADAKFREALEGELRAKSPHQRLRAVRILAQVPGWDPAGAFAREKHPAVAAALAPGRLALDDPRPPVRAGAIAAVARVRERDSVHALVQRWPEEKGRLKDDLHAALARLTGTVESDWAAWWKAQPAGWTPPPPPPQPETLPPPDSVAPTISATGRECFGLPCGSERFVLCLGDAMGWAAAQEEVNRFLASVPKGAQFGAVAFGAGAATFRKELTDVSDASRGALKEWMAKREPGGRNDLWTGLDAAFDLAERGDADTIILFNPTRPTEVGESPALVGRGQQIGFELEYRNELLRVRVLGFGLSGGGDSYFLQGLARDYGGGFIPIPDGR